MIIPIIKVGYGQIIAMTIVSGGAFCDFLNRNGVYLNLFNMWGVYFFLSLNLLYSR